MSRYLLLYLSFLPLQEVEPLPPDPTPLPSGLHCPVDNDTVYNREFGARFRGRRYYMDREDCQKMFLADPERFAKEIEPRAALFASPRPDRTSYGPFFLYFGILIVVDLFFGAMTSYVAIQKGLDGQKWFCGGFILNVLGFALVLTRGSKEMLFRSEGVRKTPATYEPGAGPKCGNLNHPSANRCSRCGQALEAGVESDVARAG